MKIKSILLTIILSVLFLYAGCQGIDSDAASADALSRAAICTPGTAITVPYSKDGVGKFVIHYISTISLGHFEITGTCSGGATATAESHLWWNFLNANSIGYCNWSVADISETSAALQPGASVDGGWTTANIKPSGILVRDNLRAMNGLSW